MSEDAAKYYCPCCASEITKCFYCDNPALYLCDFNPVILPTSKEYNIDRHYPTCDRAVCGEHYTTVGNVMFASGEHGWCDWNGLCQEHKQFKDADPFEPKRYGSDAHRLMEKILGKTLFPNMDTDSLIPTPWRKRALEKQELPRKDNEK